jgi:hypothetical protein
MIPGTFVNDVKLAQIKLFPEKTPRQFSESSYLKIEKLTRERTVTNSDTGTQNARRQQAWLDPYNFLALVIMLMVIFSPERTSVDPRLTFNSDKSSSALNEKIKMTLLSSIGLNVCLQNFKN